MSHAEGRAQLEVGWILCGSITRPENAEVDAAVERLRRRLEAAAPAFAWHWRHTRAVCPSQSAPVADLMDLVDTGLASLDMQGLDFLFIVTDAPLASGDGGRLCAATASTLGIAVISLDALDTGDQRLAVRFEALAVYLFGQLAGLSASLGAGTLMSDPPFTQGLEDRREFSPDERALLGAALTRVADARIEERGMSGKLSFYLASVAENWREILRSFVRVRPWLMPLKLSRLTTGAFSALFVLMVTAEAWELGMALSLTAVAALSLASLAGTSAYVLVRQRLLAPARAQRLTEQLAVMQFAVALGVLAGLISTYLVLFLASVAATKLLFPPDLVAGWTGLAPEQLDGARFAALSGFVSALGVIIGALGASFESQRYLRYLALIDYQLEPPA